MQAEWMFVFVKPWQWRLWPRFARKGYEFQFQWLFLYVHRIIARAASPDGKEPA